MHALDYMAILHYIFIQTGGEISKTYAIVQVL